MPEREIEAKDIRVGDTIRLEYDYCGAKCTAQAEVKSWDGDIIQIGDGLMYDPRRRDYKIVLVNRQPTERTIAPADIRPGMWVRTNGGSVSRVTNAAWFTEENEKGEVEVEDTEFTLVAKDGSHSFVTLSQVVTVVQVVSE